jgi:hypothetical protein
MHQGNVAVLELELVLSFCLLVDSCVYYCTEAGFSGGAEPA